MLACSATAKTNSPAQMEALSTLAQLLVQRFHIRARLGTGLVNKDSLDGKISLMLRFS